MERHRIGWHAKTMTISRSLHKYRCKSSILLENLFEDRPLFVIEVTEIVIVTFHN
ncbi:MAG: hypothetical protein ETSY2_03485 [Candidatus Entotheonella gemina]|uniref:Uncharacterized protein n=1 Tax=Candidatus Entotheonella gemina TaxID=1429439 RepID=W4MGF4_9BACT|nr:MAG: hypothetical protein ETSY2_03485 [Candidatus Entotheonella gemina]